MRGVKNIILIIILALSNYLLFSQESKKGSVGVAIGPTIPLGNYGDSNVKNNNAGLAQTGFHTNININYPFDESIGIAFYYSYDDHSVDESQLYDLKTVKDYNGKVETNPWKINSYLAGLLVAVPMHNSYFDIRTLIGITSAKTPAIKLTNQNGPNQTITQYPSKSTAFSFDLGIGFRFNLADEIAITLMMDYLSTNPKFEEEPLPSKTIYYFSEQVMKQRIQMLNFSIGLGYRI